MAALIGAMGALQVGNYCGATHSRSMQRVLILIREVWPVVGDGGVSETVITDRGMFLTPNTPTLVNLPKGSRVIPYAINIESMKANASDIDGLMAYRKENELPPITIETDNSRKIIGSQKKMLR